MDEKFTPEGHLKECAVSTFFLGGGGGGCGRFVVDFLPITSKLELEIGL